MRQYDIVPEVDLRKDKRYSTRQVVGVNPRPSVAIKSLYQYLSVPQGLYNNSLLHLAVLSPPYLIYRLFVFFSHHSRSSGCSTLIPLKSLPSLYSPCKFFR
jgi:hypothetical protein